MIRMRSICRDFRLGDETVHALANVDLDVADGEMIALMGPSGSGKSTLLNIIGCLDSASSGSYSLAGEETSGLSEGRLADIRQRRIGFVFQSFHLVPRLTGLKNVELPMVFAGVSSSERKERARGALHSVGLDHRMNHRPDQLSGGERQRVAIARSMVMKPDLLLADEPTGNLDTRAGNEIISVIEEMNRGGLTVVLVTHDATLAARAQRVVRLVDGRVSGNGTESPS
ncbi:MAG: ABC transporter ATP-binding protein [Planctomycetota bacterium]|nr:ABC transporter ATP-binding protein [Planctomycetota bacterium]